MSGKFQTRRSHPSLQQSSFADKRKSISTNTICSSSHFTQQSSRIFGVSLLQVQRINSHFAASISTFHPIFFPSFRITTSNSDPKHSTQSPNQPVTPSGFIPLRSSPLPPPPLDLLVDFAPSRVASQLHRYPSHSIAIALAHASQQQPKHINLQQQQTNRTLSSILYLETNFTTLSPGASNFFICYRHKESTDHPLVLRPELKDPNCTRLREQSRITTGLTLSTLPIVFLCVSQSFVQFATLCSPRESLSYLKPSFFRPFFCSTGCQESATRPRRVSSVALVSHSPVPSSCNKFPGRNLSSLYSFYRLPVLIFPNEVTQNKESNAGD